MRLQHTSEVTIPPTVHETSPRCSVPETLMLEPCIRSEPPAAFQTAAGTGGKAAGVA